MIMGGILAGSIAYKNNEWNDNSKASAYELIRVWDLI